MESKEAIDASGERSYLKNSTLFNKSAEGATFLIALQFVSRALTFIVNQYILRYLSPELLGISTQLEVYSASVLFFSRESLRVAVHRQTESKDDQPNPEGVRAGRKTQEVINLAYISIFLGFFLAAILGWGYFHSLGSTPSIVNTAYFVEALQLYGVATCFELLAEPCFVVVQQKSRYKIRALAESVATVLRCLVTCGVAVFAAHNKLDLGVLPFAIGQLASGLSLLFVYTAKVRKSSSGNGFSLMPRSIYSSNNGEIVLAYFSRPLLALGVSLFMQGVVKYVLSQGDVILVSYLASLQAQGTYALVSNYGGLIARLLFQPIEESSRNYFGKLLSSIESKPSLSVVQSASRDLHKLLRFYLILSTSAVSLGPVTAPLLLELAAGSRWVETGAGDVLAKYCYYIPFLAVNGVTEAFVSSVATEPELNRQSVWMFVFSVGFAVAGYVFLRLFKLGAEGLVWANVINMSLRILWSSNFINGYLKRNGTKLSINALMPTASTVALGVSTAAILERVKVTFVGGMGDIFKCGSIASLYIILLAATEHRHLLPIYRSLQKEKA